MPIVLMQKIYKSKKKIFSNQYYEDIWFFKPNINSML